MFDVFSNRANVVAVFERYSLIEAVRVKRNIEEVLQDMKLPSQALLEQMMAEGLSVEEFNVSVAGSEPKSSAATLSSDAVLRKHMHSLFLDKESLSEVFSHFSMTQGVHIKQLMEVCFGALRLPSESLLTMMEGEGLTMQKLGILEQEEATAKESHLDDETISRVEKAKSLLGQALASKSPNSDRLNAIKQRLNGALAINSDHTKVSEPKVESGSETALDAPVEQSDPEEDTLSAGLIPFPNRQMIASS